MGKEIKEVYIFMGKEETAEGRIEVYQLLHDCDYLAEFYTGGEERSKFFDRTADRFAQNICRDNSSTRVVAGNGKMLNLESHCIERVESLEDELVKQFSQMLADKMKLHFSNKGLVIPVPERTNPQMN
jgi:hypothetical protein